MNNAIFVPNKIKVGFRNRTDTYTGQLAYVVYYDQKNKLRKEKSWEGWRDKNIDPQDFNNEPTSGFVLNKKVGDYKSDWNHRKAYVRVYDPRNFEFEITIENLLYILENTSSIKGKGLEGDFVYGWDGTDLVLMPIASPDYEEISKYSKTINARASVHVKDLIIGATYKTNKNVSLIYLGCYNYYYFKNEKWKTSHISNSLVSEKRHYFVNKDEKLNEYSFVHLKSLSGRIIECESDEVVSNYAELMEEVQTFPFYSPIDFAKSKYIEMDINEIKMDPYYINLFALYENTYYPIQLRNNPWYNHHSCTKDNFHFSKGYCRNFCTETLDQKGYEAALVYFNSLSNKPFKDLHDIVKFSKIELYLSNDKMIHKSLHS